MTPLTPEWQRIGDTAPLVQDEQYRCVLLVNVGYSEPIVDTLKAALYVQAGLNRDITIDGHDISPPLYDAHSAKMSDHWVFAYRFHVNPDGSNITEAGVLDPWIVLAIGAAVVAVIVAAGLLDKHLERLINAGAAATEGIIDHAAGAVATDAKAIGAAAGAAAGAGGDALSKSLLPVIALGILAVVFLVVLKR